MLDGFFQAMACVGDPVGCGLNWLDSLPALVLIAVSVAIGMVAGAHMGKVAVYAVLTLGAGLLFLNRQRATDTVEVPDEDPPHIKRLKQSQRKPVDPKSAYQKWIRGDE